MKLIVIGAVAAGTSAATKASRNQKDIDITIYERDQDISYSGCGLPYYIGGEVESIEALRPRSVEFFKDKYNIDIQTRHEVIQVDKEKKTVIVRNLNTDETFEDHYDKLVIATGATSIIPPIEGSTLPHVFSLRNVQDALHIKRFIDEKKPKKALVVGTGFIGFEMLENLDALNLDVTIVEMRDQITVNLDKDMADYLEERLLEKDVKVLTKTTVASIEENKVTLSNGETMACDMVILATGVRPNVSLAKSIGCKIGVSGAIEVDNQMQTNLADIYACGDCIEVIHRVSKKPVYRPLGSTANKTGRVCGDALTGGSATFNGVLGTSIYKLYDLTIANTGLSEVELAEESMSYFVVNNKLKDRPGYFNGKPMRIKVMVEKESLKLLGAQIVGYEGVDKRIDVLATCITHGVRVDELFDIDLAYAPPYSNAKDPIHYIGMIAEGMLKKEKN